MKLPKKVAGVKTPLFVAGLVVALGIALYLRHRASVSAGTSAAAPAASTFDSGLGGGGGAISTPTDNGLGSTTVGTDALNSQDLWTSLLSAYSISSAANAEMASHAGTYTNYVTTTNYNTNTGVTTPNSYSPPTANPSPSGFPPPDAVVGNAKYGGQYSGGALLPTASKTYAA